MRRRWFPRCCTDEIKGAIAKPWWNTLIGNRGLSGIATLETSLAFTPQQMEFNPTGPSRDPALTEQLILAGSNQYFNANSYMVPPRQDLRRRGPQHAAELRTCGNKLVRSEEDLALGTVQPAVPSRVQRAQSHELQHAKSRGVHCGRGRTADHDRGWLCSNDPQFLEKSRACTDDGASGPARCRHQFERRDLEPPRIARDSARRTFVRSATRRKRGRDAN
jgi:hypothetical protein